MPIFIYIDPTEQLIVGTAKGHISVQESLAAMDEVAEMEPFDEGINILWDFHESDLDTAPDFALPEPNSISDGARHGRTAIVAPPGNQTNLLQTYESFTHEHGYDCMIFDSFQEAHSWVLSQN